jgi:hypothetical protein
MAVGLRRMSQGEIRAFCPGSKTRCKNEEVHSPRVMRGITADLIEGVEIPGVRHCAHDLTLPLFIGVTTLSGAPFAMSRSERGKGIRCLQATERKQYATSDEPDSDQGESMRFALAIIGCAIVVTCTEVTVMAQPRPIPPAPVPPRLPDPLPPAPTPPPKADPIPPAPAPPPSR